LQVGLTRSQNTHPVCGSNALKNRTFIQHNPQTHEGGEGLAKLFARIAKSHPRVNIVRLFSDGEFVFGHTEYDFSTRRIGFEVFRFEGEQAVEHWDNIQPRLGPNSSAHSMVDGPTEVTDLHKTESNRARVESYVNRILLAGDHERIAEFAHPDFVEHAPDGQDGIESLKQALTLDETSPSKKVYRTLHRVLAEGSFVLAVCEGEKQGKASAFYDLYRLCDDQIVEHWNTVEHIAPRSEWKNQNGKF